MALEQQISRAERQEAYPPWGTQGNFRENLFIPIRLALALLVIYSHAYPLIYGDNQLDPLMVLTGYHTLGSFAVDMFLAISGFLVTASWDSSSSTWSFIRKRLLRIYPAFVVIMVVQAFVIAPLATPGPFSGYTLKQYGVIIAETADLVGYGFPYGGLLTPFQGNPFPNEMNGSLWTVRYEFVCYVMLALGEGFKRRKWLAWGLVVTAAVYFSGWLPPWHKVLTAAVGSVEQWPRLLTFFLAGSLFFRLRDRIPHDYRIALVSLIGVGLTACCYPPALRLALPTGGLYLMLWIAYHPRLLFLPKWHTFDLSYGTYLYAFPTQQCIMMWLAPHFPMTPFKHFVVASLLTLPIAAASWFFIERPFLKLKTRKNESLKTS